jgi:hypothetical protein
MKFNHLYFDLKKMSQKMEPFSWCHLNSFSKLLRDKINNSFILNLGGKKSVFQSFHPLCQFSCKNNFFERRYNFGVNLILPKKTFVL